MAGKDRKAWKSEENQKKSEITVECNFDVICKQILFKMCVNAFAVCRYMV